MAHTGWAGALESAAQLQLGWAGPAHLTPLPTHLLIVTII